MRFHFLGVTPEIMHFCLLLFLFFVLLNFPRSISKTVSRFLSCLGFDVHRDSSEDRYEIVVHWQVASVAAFFKVVEPANLLDLRLLQFFLQCGLYNNLAATIIPGWQYRSIGVTPFCTFGGFVFGGFGAHCSFF